MVSGEQSAFSLLARVVGIDTPYAWQWQAYERLVAGDIPGSIVVPTAAGKTMLITAFVAALATQAASGAVTLPRRLVHVVNRRILVDEATRLAQQLAEALVSDPMLAPVRDALCRLSSERNPLVVSTLRGGLQDNGAWSLDPSTPAVILATPDMLGSRLLFRGYGLGRSRSATQAGLLGCDALIVHDEAHLAPAFTALLRQVESLAHEGAVLIGRPPLRVLEMTATLPGLSQTRPLVCDVSQDERLRARMSAAKRLNVIDTRTGDKKPQAAILDELVRQAETYKTQNKAVAIFVSNPTQAAKVADRLSKVKVPASRIVLLTGTLRGFERSRLSQTEAFRRFDPGSGREETESAYFIATSAGEIGLDIDADIGIFDLTTVDRFVQRCGRINRRGLTVGQITLVHAQAEDIQQALRGRSQAALRLLLSIAEECGARDASPLALSQLSKHDAYQAAIDSPPSVRALEPQVISMLAMTSLKLNEIHCPSPDVYIHGLVEDDARIHLAWRHLPIGDSNLTNWLENWPIAQAELAQLPIEGAKKLVSELLLAERNATTEMRLIALVLDAQGLPVNGGGLHTGDHVYRWLKNLSPGQTVLLDCGVGGLSPQGLPDAQSRIPVPDVSAHILASSADTPGAEIERLAVSCTSSDEGVFWRVLNDGSDSSPLIEASSLPALLEQRYPGKELLFHDDPHIPGELSWQGVVQVWMCDRIARTADSGDCAALSTKDRGLQEHLDLTARAAHQLSEALGLSNPLRNLLVQSGVEHDRGKQWSIWQRAIGNTDASQPLGKSARGWFSHRINDGYRHELGSLVDLCGQLTRAQSHLIATHHGWGRPTYREAALNKDGCREMAIEVAKDFDDLADHVGPWASCYLEALLKAADIQAEIRADELMKHHLCQEALTADAWLYPAIELGKYQVQLRADPANFGEYLAILGLIALLDRRGRKITLGWVEHAAIIRGVDDTMVSEALTWLCSASVEADKEATVEAVLENAYPPLRLRMQDNVTLPLNHWLDEGLQSSSEWKLGAGQTTAHKTLTSLLSACSRALQHPDFAIESLLQFGGRKVNADASKFRFDAATNWSAQNAGFSLNESDAFKSTRPWVELLSALGLQNYFLPPADSIRRYYIWKGHLSPTLALAAVKGLLPQCSQGYEAVIEPSGKMKDVFHSKLVFRERTSTWQRFIRVM